MAKFFTHIDHASLGVIDIEGQEFSGVAAAIAQMLISAGDILADEVRRRGDPIVLDMRITDELGDEVGRLRAVTTLEVVC